MNRIRDVPILKNGFLTLSRLVIARFIFVYNLHFALCRMQFLMFTLEVCPWHEDLVDMENELNGVQED